jgi:hypothetical protein
MGQTMRLNLYFGLPVSLKTVLIGVNQHFALKMKQKHPVVGRFFICTSSKRSETSEPFIHDK